MSKHGIRSLKALDSNSDSPPLLQTFSYYTVQLSRRLVSSCFSLWKTLWQLAGHGSVSHAWMKQNKPKGCGDCGSETGCGRHRSVITTLVWWLRDGRAWVSSGLRQAIGWVLVWAWANRVRL